MDETRHQQERLATYRTRLWHLLDQAAKFGSEAMAPVPFMHQLRDTRADIARVKATLRAASVVVIDAPGDFPLASAANCASASGLARRIS